MRSAKRGAGLIEAILFIVIALSLMVGGIVYFKQTSESARVSSAVQSIISLQSGIRSMFQGNSTFGVDGADLNGVTIASGALPSAMIGADGKLVNEWGGSVALSGYSTGFTVDYGAVPPEACVRLAPHSAAGAGAVGTGIAAVAINGVIIDGNGDGLVSPEEAALACGTAPTAMQMRWAFSPDASVAVAAADVEKMLGITDVGPDEPDLPPETDPGTPAPVETGRVTETETASCPPQQSGQQTRTRDVVSYSDATVVTGAWSAWNLAACADVPVEVSRTVETEQQACPADFTGMSIRNREVVTYSDKTLVPGEWSEWDLSPCVAKVTKSVVENRNVSCQTGYYGAIAQQRTVETYADGRVVNGAWVVKTNSCVSGTSVYRSYQSINQTISACSGSDKRYLVIQISQTTVNILMNGQGTGGATTFYNSPDCSSKVSNWSGTRYGNSCPANIPYGRTTQPIQASTNSSGVLTITQLGPISTAECFARPPS